MKNIKKVDARGKLTGKVKFIDDYTEKNMLYSMFLYSKKDHAKINNIEYPKDFDLSEFVIIDKLDIPGKNIVENPVMNQPLFVDDEVFYFGQPILAVAHSNQKILKEFLEKISVDYSELPAITKYKECLDNLDNVIESPKEDINNPFKSEVIIDNNKSKKIDPSWIKHTGVYYTPHQEQLYIEPQGCYAKYEPKSKTMFVKVACQCPYYVHEAIEIFFGDAIAKVEIEQVDALGGAFGGKEDYPNILAGIVALLSYKSGGKMVKIVLDREDDIQITTKRHPSRTQIVSYTDPITKQIEKLDIDFRLDSGAYQTHSPVVLARGSLHATGVYNCSDVKIHGRLFFSNTTPNGAFRGFGAPQSIFAIESHASEIAKKLNMSFVDFKNINIIRKGEQFPTTQVIEVDSAKITMDRVLKISDYHKKLKSFAKFNKSSKVKKGIGISTAMHGGGFTGTGEKVMASKIRVNIDKNALVKIFVSSTDMGQGSSTTLTQCFAEKIGHPLEKTIYQTPNTQKTPNSGPTVASRTIYIVGNLLESLADDIKAIFGNKSIEEYVKINQDEFPKDFYKTFVLDPSVKFDVATYKGTGYRDYSWASCVAEIDFDPDTYQIDVKKMWNVLDIGKRVNQQICEGQVQGGVLQGVGYATTEFIERAGLKGKSITDYIVYTTLDTPKLIVDFVDNDASRPKGLGEIPMNFPQSAIRDAFYNTTGIFINEIPILPELIMEKIKK